MTGPLQPSHEDRFRHEDSLHVSDPESYEEGQSMANGNTYDPGPSFVEDDRPTGRLSEMPAWLQSFAAQETTRDEEDSEASVDSETTQEAVAVDAQTEDVRSDDVLPDWLRDQNTSQDVPSDEHDPATMMDFLSGFDDPENPDSDSFISEDDLPDWLRAFSEEAAGPGHSAPEVTRLPASRNVPQTGSAIVRVPPVENVWLSAYERQALGPGGTLFALLASNGNGASAHAQAGSGGEFSEDARSAGSSKRDVSNVARKSDAATESGDPVPEKQSNSLRLLLLTLLVVLLVVAISFWQFS